MTATQQDTLLSRKDIKSSLYSGARKDVKWIQFWDLKKKRLMGRWNKNMRTVQVFQSTSTKSHVYLLSGFCLLMFFSFYHQRVGQSTWRCRKSPQKAPQAVPSWLLSDIRGRKKRVAKELREDSLSGNILNSPKFDHTLIWDEQDWIFCQMNSKLGQRNW